ncbi:MAG: glycosyltransferase family 4 protein [Desulfobacterales bacterium]|nr:glycosyltransferase family 4 protein [Desulfobacterales bacterium]
MNNRHQHRFPFKVAYILLWFPKPTETFIFHEIVRLRRMGLPLKVFTLYGAWKRDLSPEMVSTNGTKRMGISSLMRILFDTGYWLKRSPLTAKNLFFATASRPRAGLEKAGENLWGFLCGFSLARRFMEEEIRHIHAGWAAGPATAAWVASRLTAIPFSFSARAWDIYPPDGALAEKIRDCAFVRSETRAAIAHLERFAHDHEKKLRVIYNSLTLPSDSKAPVLMKPPFRLLAIGRFVGKKGFPLLLHSCRILRDQGVDFRLIIAGAGPLKRTVQSLCREWGLESIVSLPGFVPHNQVPGLLNRSDILIVPSVVHRCGDRDGIPTVIMEALSARVPVVATNVAGIREVIRDGLTGRLVPPGNPSSLARAVREMTADRSLAIEMAEEGRRLVLRQFDPERNCRALFHLMVETSSSGSAESFARDGKEVTKG